MPAFLLSLASRIGFTGWLLIAAIAAIGVQTWRLHDAQTDTAKAQAETAKIAAQLTATRAQVATLADQLADQNAAVLALKKAGEEQQKRTNSASKAAQIALADAYSRIQDIEATRLPDTCPARLDWALDRARQRAIARDTAK